NASGTGALAVKGGSYKQGANVTLASSDPAPGARCFKLQSVGKHVRLVNTRTYQAVAVKGASAQDGANVVQTRMSSSKAQLWTPSINRDGSISFKNAASGKMLARTSGSANVVQKAAGASSSKAWRLKAVKRYSLSGNTKLDKGLAGILATHSTLRSAYNCIRDDYKWDSPDTAYRSGKYMSDDNTKRYALQMIKRGKGSCYCTSSTVMWLARALGYDADVTVGYLYSNIPGVIGAHSWVEVRKGGVAYVCDADCERGLPGHDFFMKRYPETPAEYHFWE
ncbi:MAG: RICIN domain-containing protein, partial [Coriobacteriia bacterium]|nr:RICIN domain-containing protein [Coriobacteriia bacterium]